MTTATHCRVVIDFSAMCADAVSTLTLLRRRGYRLGLLFNTRWVAGMTPSASLNQLAESLLQEWSG